MTKQHILREIKRIALVNGGCAPGMHKFYRETGCRRSDWYGKHWVRWNDAIKEAGLVPNQMQESYEENSLIENLIDLAREIGHFPIHGDLRMKIHNDPEFPCAATFRSRLGTKSQLVAKVAEYCRQRTGFEDVLRMREAASPKIKSDKVPEEEVESVEEFEFVYLIKSGRFYKIGRSNSVGRREYELGVQLPVKPTTIHSIRTDDPDGIEAYWHRRFAAKRKGGEWFNLNTSDIKAFKKWLRIV